MGYVHMLETTLARQDAELDRLRAVNEELLAALCDMAWAFGEPGPSGLVRWAADNLDRSGWTQAAADRMDACLAAARSAIALAIEVTPPNEKPPVVDPPAA